VIPIAACHEQNSNVTSGTGSHAARRRDVEVDAIVSVAVALGAGAAASLDQMTQETAGERLLAWLQGRAALMPEHYRRTAALRRRNALIRAAADLTGLPPQLKPRARLLERLAKGELMARYSNAAVTLEHAAAWHALPKTADGFRRVLRAGA
jgi:hypothetical protein